MNQEPKEEPRSGSVHRAGRGFLAHGWARLAFFMAAFPHWYDADEFVRIDRKLSACEKRQSDHAPTTHVTNSPEKLKNEESS